MKVKHYTVLEVPGSKRSSQRPYTHAIVGRSFPTLLAIHSEREHKANARKRIAWERKHWADEKRLSECPSGGTYINHNNFRTTASDALIQIGKDFIAKYPTPESYIDHLEREFQDYIAKLKAMPVGELSVLQWSMSHSNAFKGQSKWVKSHADVRVVECFPVVDIKTVEV